MTEILAPAGNKDCAIAAINSGANAIYLGYSNFSARQSAENFTLNDLSEIISEAHFFGVKVYVAMNTLVKNTELEEFINVLISVWNVGADAIIMQDLFLAKYIHDKYPEIVLHLSTQAGITNEYGAKLAKCYGISRVILARETPFDEIKKITKIIETEVFVQGALCTCFSGQCYLSSYVGGNSGNRGRCKQPCRKKYSYNRNGFEEHCYALSLSDLCVGENIYKLMEIGVTSFKIEGRMRRSEYVAASVCYYKNLIENASQNVLNSSLSNLKRTYNRGNYTSGLAFGQDKRFLSRSVQGHIGEKVGVVKVVSGKYFVESTSKRNKGDAFKILRQGVEVGGATFENNDRHGFTIVSREHLKNGDGVFITTDVELNEKLLSNVRKETVKVSLNFIEGQNAYANINGIEIYSPFILQKAEKQALTENDLISCFEKIDTMPINVVFENINIEGNIFIPKSLLNSFRREAYEKFRLSKISSRNEIEVLPFEKIEFEGKNNKIAIISNDFDNISCDIAILKLDDLRNAELNDKFTHGNFEKYIYYPAFTSTLDNEKIKEIIDKYSLDGIYAENYGGIEFCKENGYKIFLGTGLNISENIAIKEILKDDNIKYYALSKELDEKEQKALLCKKSFTFNLGSIKVMDLCYCPFSKTCSVCDKKKEYILTDEQMRKFPVRRYISANGECRFEIFNCAEQIGALIGGSLIDLSTTNSKPLYEAKNDVQAQKQVVSSYTSGHTYKSVL